MALACRQMAGGCLPNSLLPDQSITHLNLMEAMIGLP